MSDEILNKLDKIIALLSVQGKTDEEKNEILRKRGFTYREISELTGVPTGTLKTWVHQNKKSS